jgi:hypothetical protein
MLQHSDRLHKSVHPAPTVTVLLPPKAVCHLDLDASRARLNILNRAPMRSASRAAPSFYSGVGTSSQFNSRVEMVPDRLAGIFGISPFVSPAISSTPLLLVLLLLLTN